MPAVSAKTATPNGPPNAASSARPAAVPAKASASAVVAAAAMRAWNAKIAAEATEVGIKLVDNTGRTVHRQLLQAKAGANQWTLRLPTLPSGVYYLQLTTGGLTSSKAITVQ